MTGRVAQRVVAAFLAAVEPYPGLTAVMTGLVDRLPAGEGGAHVYACGGLVRDLALAVVRGVPAEFKDVDLVLSGIDDPDLERVLGDLRARLPAVRWVERVGASFPVWKVRVSGLDEPVDVSVVRTRASFGAGRGFVAVGSTSLTIADDANHRDFTLNAMYVELGRGSGGSLVGRLIDLHDGLEAIAAGEIRCVGAAAERFAEDPLRIVRAVRFATAVEGFRIATATADEMRAQAPRLGTAVAGDRVADELYRTLAGNPAGAFEVMAELGLMEVLLPDLAALGDTARGRVSRRLELLEEEVGGRPRPPLLYAAVLLDLALPAGLPQPPFASADLRTGRVGRVARDLNLPDVRAIERLAHAAQAVRHRDQLESPDAALEELLGRYSEQSEVVALFRAAERAEGRCPADVVGRLAALPETRVDFAALVERLGLAAGPLLGRLRLALRQAEIEGGSPDDEVALSVLRRLSG